MYCLLCNLIRNCILRLLFWGFLFLLQIAPIKKFSPHISVLQWPTFFGFKIVPESRILGMTFFEFRLGSEFGILGPT